jgi:hypothetical protein
MSSTIDNSSFKIQPKHDSCTFELIGITEVNTNITASALNYKDSETKSLQVLNKFQLSVTKFDTHIIGLNACLPINVKSIVGVENDLNIILQDTPDSPSPRHSSLCTIKKGSDHCSVNLCSNTTAGEMILSTSDSNYTISFPEDISVHVLESFKISTDPIIPDGTVMGIKEIKPITVKIPFPAEADITVNVKNIGTGTGGFNGNSCIINKNHDNCSLNLIAANAGTRSVTLATDTISPGDDLIYPSLNLGKITVNNSLLLDVPNPQFIVDQENKVIIKLPAGSPNVTKDITFHLIIGSGDGSYNDFDNLYCVMLQNTNTCTMKVKARKAMKSTILYAEQSVSDFHDRDYDISNQVAISAK